MKKIVEIKINYINYKMSENLDYCVVLQGQIQGKFIRDEYPFRIPADEYSIKRLEECCFYLIRGLQSIYYDVHIYNYYYYCVTEDI